MSIPDWVNEGLKKISKPEPKKFIMDLLELGDITPYNGKYYEMVKLTRKYKKGFCKGNFNTEAFSYLGARIDGVLVRTMALLEEKGSALEKLETVKAMLNGLDLKADVFRNNYITKMFTINELNAIRDEIIEDVIERESRGLL